MRNQLIWLPLFLIHAIASGMEIRWVQFNVNLRYSSPKKTCSNFGVDNRPIEDGFILLAMEIKGGKVVKAKWNNFPNVFPYNLGTYRGLEVSNADLDNIVLYQSPKGDYWVSGLKLSAETLTWILPIATNRAIFCQLPSKIQIPPLQNLEYLFETEGFNGGISKGYGNWLKINGFAENDGGFSIDLQLVQRKVSNLWIQD